MYKKGRIDRGYRQVVYQAPVQQEIIIDDCSSDGTRDMLEQEIKPLVPKVIYHEKNQVNGAAGTYLTRQ